MLSDTILSLFAFYYFLQHRKLDKKWSLFFLFMGLSAFIGGIYHGFINIGEQFKYLSWSFLSASLISAQLAVYKSNKNLILKIIFISKSVVLLFISIQNNQFDFMVIDIAASMLGFILIGDIFFLKSLSKYINYGIVISFTSVFAIIAEFNIHPEYGTTNDIGHYISVLSLMMISKGVHKNYFNNQLESQKA